MVPFDFPGFYSHSRLYTHNWQCVAKNIRQEITCSVAFLGLGYSTPHDLSHFLPFTCSRDFQWCLSPTAVLLPWGLYAWISPASGYSSADHTAFPAKLMLRCWERSRSCSFPQPVEKDSSPGCLEAAWAIAPDLNRGCELEPRGMRYECQVPPITLPSPDSWLHFLCLLVAHVESERGLDVVLVPEDK